MSLPRPPSTWLASAVVVTCLGLQLCALARVACPPRALGLGLPRVACAPRLWPFLDYPMFSEAHGPGASIERDVAVLRLEGGRELRLAPGLRAPAPAQELVDALRSGNAAALATLVLDHERATGERVRELLLVREGFVLTRDGFGAERPVVLRRLELDGARGSR